MKIKFAVYFMFFLSMSLPFLLSCKKESVKTLPTVKVAAVVNFTANSAICGGEIIYDGGASVSARGICWSTSQNPSIIDNKTNDGTGIGIFSRSINGLKEGTTYNIRAYAINSVGTAYSNQVTFTTLALEPLLTTIAASAISSTSAFSGGNITNDGGSPVTARGVCWSTNQNPTITDSKTNDGTGSGSFTSAVTGLIPGTIYYIRAYASNSAGTAYGNQTTLTTWESDIDGNVYHTVTIGSQVWMTENLKTTKYRNGDPISNVIEGGVWTTLTTGAYCWYNNDAASYKNIYGALYNWYAVSDSRNLAPAGWHVATDADWTILISYLGGESLAGGKLKEIGLTHWTTPNAGATNSSNFTSLPAGFRAGSTSSNGVFDYLGRHNYFWSTTADASSTAWSLDLSYNDSKITRLSYDKRDGFSVRCVKD